MTGFMAKPEVEFRVGEIRVRIWHNPVYDPRDKMQSNYLISMERQSAPGLEATETVATLPALDIPKAILALKKAHDYLQLRKREGQPPQDFQSAAERAPQRIP